MDCIFCKIIKGELPSYTVYEDERVKAFLDVNPTTNGHTLVIPKKHFSNLYDMDLEELKAIEMTCQQLGKWLKEKLNCQGITRLQNNEYGQEVKHYHMHLIPRYKEDKIEIKSDKKALIQIEKIFEKITK